METDYSCYVLEYPILKLLYLGTTNGVFPPSLICVSVCVRGPLCRMESGWSDRFDGQFLIEISYNGRGRWFIFYGFPWLLWSGGINSAGQVVNKAPGISLTMAQLLFLVWRPSAAKEQYILLE